MDEIEITMTMTEARKIALKNLPSDATDVQEEAFISILRDFSRYMPLDDAIGIALDEYEKYSRIGERL